MAKTLANVTRVYSGKPGCMCGCKGKYSENARSKAIIYNKIMNSIDKQYDDGANAMYVETKTRNLVAYFD